MRFFISRLSSLGDVVCSLPAAAALKEAYPDCEIVWAVSQKFADIVRCCSAVDHVEAVADPRAYRPSGEFDGALDLQGLLKSAILVGRARSRNKVGYHWQREGSSLFSRRVLPDPSSLHVVDQYVDVARALGGKADRASFALIPPLETVEKMTGSLPSNFVAINPGAAWASKRWAPASVARLCDLLAAEGMETVLLGSPNETVATEVEGLAKSKPINLSGKTSLIELVALISLSRVHVGGDTGTTHIAAGLGVPAIGLYASTLPQRSCPYGQIHRCIHEAQGLSAIGPEAVFAKVTEALS